MPRIKSGKDEERRKRLTERRMKEALERGKSTWHSLMTSEGGSISSAAVAETLGTSRTTVLRKYHNGQVLGWRDEGKSGIRFPVWQFEGGRILPGLATVIAALNQGCVLDDKARILFFLLEFGFAACRPLDLLRKRRITDALLAAKAYAE